MNSKENIQMEMLVILETVGAALRRDHSEAVPINRGINPLLQFN
jgi:hypothetical protein